MYWHIIVTSIAGTKYFMMMCGVIILSFGIAIYILDHDQATMFVDEVAPVYQDKIDTYVTLTD